MLEYEWGNQSSVMHSGGGEEETGQGHDSETTRTDFGSFTTQNYSETPNYMTTPQVPHFTAINNHYQIPYQNQNPHSDTHFSNNFYDSTRVYGGSSSSYVVPQPSMMNFEPAGPTGFMVVPKTEFNTDYNSRIGLNLGGRTYFASTEDDFVNRLYRRSRILEPGSHNSPKCQAEGCNADLTHAKHYHRRHKVCEFHSKASTVIAAGLTQRFCQQCSRFHLLTEFDNGKRSCRRRLADHNRRRRKSQQSNQENSKNSQLEGNAAPNSSSENLSRSPHESEPHPSSVTVAISPPTTPLDCFGRPSRSFLTCATSSSTTSTSSLFYS